MNRLGYQCILKLTAAVLFVLLLAAKPVFANGGVVTGRTYVLGKTQYPAHFKKTDATAIYLLYWGSLINDQQVSAGLLRGDTILDYRKFERDFPNGKGFRLIYATTGVIDSILQYDQHFRLSGKAYNLGNELLKIEAYDSSGHKSDQFIFNFGERLNEQTRGKQVDGTGKKGLAWLVRQFRIYDSYDRNNYAVGAVWMLSIGIDDYGVTKYKSCKSDADSYSSFFRNQYLKGKPTAIFGSFFHNYVLLDSAATKDAILAALKEIAANAGYNDYFIFNFSGCSNVIQSDALNAGTYFFPYDVVVNTQSLAGAGLQNRSKTDTTDPYKNCITLQQLQEYIQLIPANNQLFISEAGPSEKFKTEFVKTLMQNSSAVAGILNKNRIIIVPNGFGSDQVSCQQETFAKGPINYYITSLPSTLNIYDIFKEGREAEEVAFSIKNKFYTCQSFAYSYFDIFFEKKFLQEHQEIFGDEGDQTRGLDKKPSKELEEAVSGLTGKRYALLIGTDQYAGKGWNNLQNPVKDAEAVADELTNSYGFEVQLLSNKPMDTIYKVLMDYYRFVKPNDQVVIYFAGHGDVDEEILSDGFIVCTDSKSVEEDAVRNSYIAYGKLKKMLNNLPAKQVLVLLDVCHGGTFDAHTFEDGKREGGLENISNRNVLRFLKDKLPLRTRKFLSSVGSEPAFDGKAGKHSPFANLLLQVLRARGEGSNGIITLSDIHAVLQTASLNETATLRISPHMADFGDVDAFSEFIFIPRKQ